MHVVSLRVLGCRHRFRTDTLPVSYQSSASERRGFSADDAAPFAAPLAYTGLGFLLLMNRMVSAETSETMMEGRAVTEWWKLPLVPLPCGRWRSHRPTLFDKTLAVPLIPPLSVRAKGYGEHNRDRPQSLKGKSCHQFAPPSRFHRCIRPPPNLSGTGRRTVSCLALLRQRPARRPLRDFLENPRVAIRVLEGNVGTVTFALWIRTTDARRRGERRAVEDFCRLDTAGHDIFVSRHDIGDDQPVTERAGLGVRNSFTKRDRGR